ncbi:hypothetical protein QMZ92_17625 [Streptomyces sp. HNM0645]|uniref:hypothetical protein n=1 Tax=Streptomyces sp. HNM0645 TaxID=2782343 RepID=UPI0024B7853F|nr:hypothetical protein [Streptomyces sp. HNM0645]MDI9886150.1 hypothetical protein [Streptomyces sp. HNM0645]
MADYDFPDELRDAQLRLHRARSAYRALCRELPWSVEPAEGWTGEEGHYSSYRREFPESPGWSEEQRAEEARLRELVLTLSIEVSTHPYWAALEAPDVVKARMALKHAEDGNGTVHEDGNGTAHKSGGAGSGEGGTARDPAGDDSGAAPPVSSAAA